MHPICGHLCGLSVFFLFRWLSFLRSLGAALPLERATIGFLLGGLLLLWLRKAFGGEGLGGARKRRLVASGWLYRLLELIWAESLKERVEFLCLFYKRRYLRHLRNELDLLRNDLLDVHLFGKKAHKGCSSNSVPPCSPNLPISNRRLPCLAYWRSLSKLELSLFLCRSLLELNTARVLVQEWILSIKEFSKFLGLRGVWIGISVHGFGLKPGGHCKWHWFCCSNIFKSEIMGLVNKFVIQGLHIFSKLEGFISLWMCWFDRADKLELKETRVVLFVFAESLSLGILLFFIWRKPFVWRLKGDQLRILEGKRISKTRLITTSVRIH